MSHWVGRVVVEVDEFGRWKMVRNTLGSGFVMRCVKVCCGWYPEKAGVGIGHSESNGDGAVDFRLHEYSSGGEMPK